MKKPENDTNAKKICKKCDIPKDLEEYSKHKGFKDGYSSRCKECDHQYQKIYNSNNDNKIRKQLYQGEYNILNKEKNYKYQKERKKILYKTDPLFKLEISLRSRLYKAINKNKGSKNLTTICLLGCSVEKCKQYLESQFKPEMNWNNQGKVWEIDHIKPCSSFDLTNKEEQKLCFHFSNLQPLFSTTKIAESFGYTDQIGNRNKNKY